MLIEFKIPLVSFIIEKLTILELFTYHSLILKFILSSSIKGFSGKVIVLKLNWINKITLNYLIYFYWTIVVFI